MLRIHFTAGDLLRTRVMRGPHLLWEIVLSAHLLQNREGVVVFREWRCAAGPRVHPKVRPLLELAPHAGYFPDFLTPGQGGVDLEHGIQEVLSTPRRRLAAEVGELARQQPLSPWIRDLGAGAGPAVNYLGVLLRQYHDAVIAPFWPSIVGHCDADRSVRSRALVDGGCEGLLESLRPTMRWNFPVLEVDYPFDQDLDLQGRGLVLIPSYFCWRMPVALADRELPPVLVYPVAHDLGADASGLVEERLAALLGRTRAAVLGAVGDGCTTSELASRVEVSLASASQHASVLRDAGLVVTRRRGGSVLHSVTPLGSGLLRGQATVLP